MTKYWLTGACSYLLGILSLCSPVRGEEWSDRIFFNGYYGLNATYADSDIALIGTAGRERRYEQGEINAEDSLVGGKLEYVFTDTLSAVVQGAAFFRPDGSFTSAVDWAYLSYDFGTDNTLRAGQFQIPVLQGIELKNVGFSRLSARPFIPGSGAGGFNDYRGVEYLKHISALGGDWDFQVAAGEPEHDLDQIDGNALALIAARYSRGDSWIRAAVLNADYDVDTNQGAEVDTDAQAVMASVEAETRYRRLIVNLGYSTSRADIAPDDYMVYGSLGVQMGAVTPYALYVKRQLHFTPFEPPRPSGGPVPGPGSGANSPPPAPPPAPDGDRNAYSVAAGVRWFLNERTSVKFQWDYTRNEDKQFRLPSSQDGNSFTIVLEGVF